MLFAKECATIDLLSEGRFTLGIGAGWSAKDYAIAGIQQDDALTCIERLREAVRVMKGLWADGPFSFSGEHYEVAEVDAVPKPNSKIPVMIGGGGPKILALRGDGGRHRRDQPEDRRRAFNPIGGHRSRRRDGREGRCCPQCRRKPFDDLELQVQVLKTVVTDQPRDVAEQLSPAFGVPPDVLLNAPFFQIGSVEQITENIIQMRERWGVSYVLFQSDGIQPLAPVVAKLTGT